MGKVKEYLMEMQEARERQAYEDMLDNHDCHLSPDSGCVCVGEGAV